MKLAIRLLLALVVVEIVVVAGIAATRAARTVALLPDVRLNDPLIMPQLQQLAETAESGTSADWTRLGEALVGKGFYAHAEFAFREALRRDAESFAAQFGLAFTLDRTGRTQESSREYDHALFLPADNFELPFAKHYAFYAKGRNALRRENLVNAEDMFQQNADFAPADYQLAKIWIRSGRAAEALPIIDRNLQRIPYSLEFHFLRMRAMQALDRSSEAFDSAVMLERSAPLVSMNFSTDYVAPLDARVGITPLMRQLGELSYGDDGEEIEKRCQKIKALLDGRSVFVSRLVDDLRIDAALRAGDAAHALQVIDEVRKTGREDASIIEYEGDALTLQGGAKDRAADCWRRALLLSPSAELHQKLADYYGAEDPASRDQHLSRVAFRNGVAEYRDNQLETAVLSLRRAAELNPQDPAPWFYQGEIQFHLGRIKEAQESFERCLALQPEHGRAAAKLDHLLGR